jgi:hypothetical protein
MVTAMQDLFQPLLLLLASGTYRELAYHVQYLKEENRIFRGMLSKHIILTPGGVMPDAIEGGTAASNWRHTRAVPDIRKNRPMDRKSRQETAERPPYHSP